jgi:CDP-diacylglycerol---glycerol-3-phosphate 3-phosphatidyltransferase
MRKKDLPNKLTFLRIILAIIILLLLGLPWQNFNVNWPIYLVGGKVILKLNYLVSAILFVIAALTDMFDGKLARKYNAVTNYGKVMDAIADKVLVNGILIILAYNHDISVIVPVIIVIRDIVVDAIKMVSGNNGKVVAASMAGKIKTAFMMVGITFVLVGNIPFEFFNIAFDQGLILVATCLSIYSGIEYYLNNKELLMENE